MLANLGWDAFFERGCTRDGIPARVASEHRGAYEVWAETSQGAARIAGQLRKRGELPAVGDWVLLDRAPDSDNVVVIHHVLERRTVFTRGTAGRDARMQVVAANVDRVFVVCGLDEDFNLRRIERYVARVWASGALPIVVLSKADLVSSEDTARRVAEVEACAPGVEVAIVSALRGDGLDTLRARIGFGKTAALVGSSGAGKSTLVNALVGEERMATGAVRARDGRGQHVTTHRQLTLLPGGGLLLDTPGMRELQLLDEEGLSAAFEDVDRLAQGCRFSDCGHGEEPGCAVHAAIATGELAPERLAHFLQLRREARAYERRHDARLRRTNARTWGKLTREAARARRAKSGD